MEKTKEGKASATKTSKSYSPNGTKNVNNNNVNNRRGDNNFIIAIKRTNSAVIATLQQSRLSTDDCDKKIDMVTLNGDTLGVRLKT